MSGARAPLATPVTCGTKTATARLSSWSRPNAQTTLTDSFYDHLRSGRLRLRGDPRRAPVHAQPRRRAGKPGLG